MSARPRLLFVDDEASVLAGLRRQLFDRRQAWDMEFAAGGEEALLKLEASPADVIVSDMRMPGMDGAALLEQVRLRWPATVRVLLTGYTDQEQKLRSVRSAHQVLNKPCEAGVLRSTLALALELGAMVPDPELKSDLAQLVALPVLSSVQQGIQRELDRGEASLRRLGELVEHDPGLSAKALQLVNSAAMGLPQRVSRPAQAVALLGLDMVRCLWTALKVQRGGGLLSDSGTLDSHGEEVAMRCRATLHALGDASAYLGFSAGLLHDVGAQALQHCRPEAWALCQGAGDLQRERELCGADHAAAGAYLLGLWGMDPLVVRAVARHHEAPNGLEPLEAALARAEAAVAVRPLQRA